MGLQFYLDIHARGQVDAVEQFRVGRIDVDDSLVRAKFELFAAVLMLMRAAENGHDLALRGKRNGSRNFCPALLHRLYDPLRRLIDKLVIVSRKFDSDFLCCHLSAPFFIPTVYSASTHPGVSRYPIKKTRGESGVFRKSPRSVAEVKPPHLSAEIICRGAFCLAFSVTSRLIPNTPLCT